MKKWLVFNLSLILCLLCAACGKEASPAPCYRHPDYQVAYVNYAGETPDLPTVLNRGSGHMPIFKCESREELEQFREEYQNTFYFSGGYDEVPSFDALYPDYDEAFFAEHALLLVYRSANSGSYRYGIDQIMIEGENVTVYVKQRNDPGSVTDDMAGWLLMTPIRKADIKEGTAFDARMTTP